jgi:hypothetical protein
MSVAVNFCGLGLGRKDLVGVLRRVCLAVDAAIRGLLVEGLLAAGLLASVVKVFDIEGILDLA